MHCYLGKRKDSPNWYIYEYDERNKQCKRYPTRTRDRTEAEKRLAEHVIRSPQKQVFAAATLIKILLRYWEQHASRRFSKDTVRRVMGLVCDNEPETNLYDWPIDRQKEFASKCGRTSSTQRRYMGVIRAAVQWTFDRGEIPSMPPIFKPRAQDGEGVRPFSFIELAHLLNSADHEHERRFLLLCICSAARPGAVLDLTWDRIDKETGVIDYNVPGRERTKKRRARAPLCSLARAYLEDRRSVGPVIQWNGRALKGFKMTFTRIAKRARIEGTAYGIRKSVSIWLRREGVHEWDIKGMLGHAIGGETERYAHYRPEYMRAAAESVERLLRQICPPWLASHLPVEVPRETQVLVSNGGRDRDRTCDPYHVKVVLSR